MQHEILHRLPGRIRFRLERVRNDADFQWRLHNYFKSIPGVLSVRVAPACASLTISFDEAQVQPETVLAELSAEVVLKTEPGSPRDLRKDLNKSLEKFFLYKLANKIEAPPVVQVMLGAASFASVALGLPGLISRSILGIALMPIIGRGLRTFMEEGRPAVEFMDAASVIVLSLESAYFPASIMVLLIGTGEYIREFAAIKSEGMVDTLLSMSHSSAWLVNDDTRTRVPVEEVQLGDTIVVYTGEQVPVNGVVEEGSASVIKPSSRPDALPIEAKSGTEIKAGSVILEGKLYLKCSARRSPAKIDRSTERERQRLLYRTAYQRSALKRAYKVISPILFFSATTFLLSRNLLQAFTIICFDFVTGMRIALPTSVLSFMYRAGKEGVLIKSGAALEELAGADVIILARTGVITDSDSKVTEIISLSDESPDQLLAKAAAVEYRYHHPAARAIYRAAKEKKIKIAERKNSRLFAGMGVQGELQKQTITVGSARLMRQLCISTEKAQDASEYIKSRADSVAYCAINNELAGLISYRDSVRPEANRALKKLRELGISEIVMTSGDAPQSAGRTASEIGVDKTYTRLTPAEKVQLVREYQNKGMRVVIIGDDVSDAQAMAAANLSVAMSSSTDLARYRAEIILTDDDLTHLPSALSLSRDTMRHLRQNMYLVSVPSWAGLVLSLANRIGPIFATVLNNGPVILAALYGLLPALAPARPKRLEIRD